jgi:putative FmdB family regulatory protein
VPTYEYRCTECGHGFEAVQAFTDNSIEVCPSCGGKVRKLFGNVGIVFKGSGFYKTDSRSKTAAASGANGNGSGDGASANGSDGDKKSGADAKSGGDTKSGSDNGSGGSESSSKSESKPSAPADKPKTAATTSKSSD